VPAALEDLSHYKYKSLLITGLATFLGTLDSSIVNVSLPTISREMGASVELVGWIILAYAIAVISFLMVFGAVAEKKGYQISYVYGFLIFALGSLFCGLSYNIYFLIAMRGIQGIGAALLIAVGPALLTRTFPESERGRGLSMIAMVVSTGLMLGPPLGGFIIALAGWRWIFFVNLPFAILGIYFTKRYISDFPITSPDRKISFPGAATLSLALLILMAALSLFSRHILSESALAALSVVSVLAFGMFFYFEGKPKTRLIGLEIFRNRVFSFSGSAMFLVFVSLSSVTVLLPFYLEQVHHYDPEEVGLILMILPLCGLFMAPLAGYLADKIQARIISTLGVLLMLAGILLVRRLDDHSTLSQIITALLFVGLGMGLFSTPNTSSIMGAAKKTQLGSASGILATIRSLGLAIGVSLAIAIFGYYQNLHLKTGADKLTSFIAAYREVYLIILFFAVGAIILSLVRGRNIQPETKDKP
jgi:EmrB/QacA subfamily drug resistance transporter